MYVNGTTYSDYVCFAGNKTHLEKKLKFKTNVLQSSCQEFKVFIQIQNDL